MHGGGRNEDDPVAEMNMIPLIDISLTLLIIMMITTTFVKQPGFALKLPEAAARQGKPETPKDLVVAVDRAGKFWMDGKNTNDAEMLRTLTAAYERNHDVRVLVKGDEGVPYGKVSHAMDIISLAKITHINLPTNPKPGRENVVAPAR
jgi:biopolymer transport protein TolR